MLCSQIADPNNEAINFTQCGRSGLPQAIFSTSNMLTLTLTSNIAVEGDGYRVNVTRIPCPSVSWNAPVMLSAPVSLYL